MTGKSASERLRDTQRGSYALRDYINSCAYKRYINPDVIDAMESSEELKMILRNSLEYLTLKDLQRVKIHLKDPKDDLSELLIKLCQAAKVKDVKLATGYVSELRERLPELSRYTHRTNEPDPPEQTFGGQSFSGYPLSVRDKV